MVKGCSSQLASARRPFAQAIQKCQRSRRDSCSMAVREPTSAKSMVLTQPDWTTTSSGRRRVAETPRLREEATVADGDSAGVVLRVHVHRDAVVCSTPTTQQIPAASAFAQTQRCGSAEPRQPPDDRIPGERSSRHAPTRRCLSRQRDRSRRQRRTCAFAQKQSSAAAAGRLLLSKSSAVWAVSSRTRGSSRRRPSRSCRSRGLEQPGSSRGHSSSAASRRPARDPRAPLASPLDDPAQRGPLFNRPQHPVTPGSGSASSVRLQCVLLRGQCTSASDARCSAAEAKALQTSTFRGLDCPGLTTQFRLDKAEVAGSSPASPTAGFAGQMRSSRMACIWDWPLCVSRLANRLSRGHRRHVLQLADGEIVDASLGDRRRVGDDGDAASASAARAGRNALELHAQDCSSSRSC
jgi:hypothetical protein